MKIRSRISFTALMLALLVIISATISSCSSTTTPGTTTPVVFNDSDISGGIFKPASKPAGKTYSQWSVAWWQWAMSMPATNNGSIYNPLLDSIKGGTQANLGNQGSSIFFLGGLVRKPAIKNVTRTVTIPHGDAIFFPLAATIEDQYTVGASRADTMQAHLVNFIGYHVGDLNIKLDNVPILTITNRNLFRFTSGGSFSYTLPDNNLYQYRGVGAIAGTVNPAYADGYYVMLGPLKAGSHVLTFNGSIDNNTQIVTYNITSN